MIRKTFFILLAATTLNLQAQPPVQQAPASSILGGETITCPQYLEGWPFEVINPNDCHIPGINVKTTCVKWNNQQLSVPAGWQYADIGRYASMRHIVSGHNVATAYNKTYLYCSYSLNRTHPVGTTYVIRREAPSGKICTKTDNYSFSCQSRSLERIRREIRR